MKIESLYGMSLSHFKLLLSADGLQSNFHPVTVDFPKSNISPANGCDIIIHGQSANSQRIFSLNPDLVTSFIQTTVFSGTLKVELFGYCLADEENRIESLFKEAAKDKVMIFSRDQIKQIQALTDLLLPKNTA